MSSSLRLQFARWRIQQRQHFVCEELVSTFDRVFGVGTGLSQLAVLDPEFATTGLPILSDVEAEYSQDSG